MSNILRVDLDKRSYNIHIGKGCLQQLPDLLNEIPKDSKHILITDQIVFDLYGNRLLKLLGETGFEIEAAIIKGGEECKTLSTVAALCEQMLAFGLDRHSSVFALGGGIVGDIAGFAASSYMRGIGFVQIPTTLLAQVDSSVGGKTGVNLPQGKNLVGAFYQPQLVFIDVDFIYTLPEKEYLTGLAEVIKYGIIWDGLFFSYLETNWNKIIVRDSDCLLYMTSKCCTIKADIVSQDEKETGMRALLNLGHTFGHAFEALTNYQIFTHGEAIAIGMIYAARLANSMGLLSIEDTNRIEGLLKNYGLPSSYGKLLPSDVLAKMLSDKKSIGGRLTLVLPTGIGKSQLVSDISGEQIQQTLQITAK